MHRTHKVMRIRARSFVEDQGLVKARIATVVLSDFASDEAASAMLGDGQKIILTGWYRKVRSKKGQVKIRVMIRELGRSDNRAILRKITGDATARLVWVADYKGPSS